MKAAIYVRVSTEDQRLETQIDICSKWIEANGHEIFAVYKDIWTGKDMSRPAFNELLKDMREYKFHIIVVTKLDRLGRSLQHLLSLVEEFKTKGVHFVAATQSIDTTSPTGVLQLQIMGAFAEFERNMISERTKEGLKGNTRVGKRGPDKQPRKKRGARRKALSLPYYVKGNE